MTFYYDPSIDYHHRLPVGWAGLFPAYFLAPQKPVEARALLDAALAQRGLPGTAPVELPGPQRTPLLIHLAREWNLSRLADTLGTAADEQYEPTWDLERGEFTWGFGLGEEHPRGQFNASMAAAEATSEGAWWRLFNLRSQGRFTEPTVVGIDFPDLALTQASWDADRRLLFLATAPRSDRVVGRPTTFRLTNLGDASAWAIDSGDGTPTAITRADADLEVTTTIGEHRFTARRA